MEFLMARTMNPDVVLKRTLVAAIHRAQKRGKKIGADNYGVRIVGGKFVAGKRCCTLGAYLDGKDAPEPNGSIEQNIEIYLGDIATGIKDGVDNLGLYPSDSNIYRRGYAIGRELRERFIE